MRCNGFAGAEQYGRKQNCPLYYALQTKKLDAEVKRVANFTSFSCQKHHLAKIF